MATISDFGSVVSRRVTCITEMRVFTKMTPGITGMTLKSTEMTLNFYQKNVFHHKYIKLSINVFIIVNNWYNYKTDNGWIVGKL